MPGKINVPTYTPLPPTQISRWGEVEWQHTVDESDLKAKLTAGLIMKQLSNNV